VGKWHLGHAEKLYFPHARGFEHFYGHVTGGIGYWDHNHGGGHDWQRNGLTLRETGYATRLIADEAVDLLEGRDRNRPTFLFASFNAPHLPNEAPAKSIDAYAASIGRQRRIHAAMVSELDTAVGRILSKLAEEGMREETLIWFFSDNGGLNPSASTPGILRAVETLTSLLGAPLPIPALEFLRSNTLDGVGDNSPLRAGKTSVYEGGIRVPSAIWWPSHTEPGRSDAFVTALDVVPTLLEAAGLPGHIPGDLDGISRWSAIRDEPMSPAEELHPPDYRVQGIGGVALIRPPWKLVLPPTLPFLAPVPELYQIYEDPSESRDLAARHPTRVAHLHAALEAWPLGPEIHAPLYRVIIDPDAFGGPEDRLPWGEAAH